VLIVGNPGEAHVGRHLLLAAGALGTTAELIDVAAAWGGHAVVRRALWVWDHRPYRLRQFGQHVLEQCERFTPTVVIVTGISPPGADVVRTLAVRGVVVVNLLTDDPFNPAHRARWFARVLPEYHTVFTPRRSNAADLTRVICRRVVYLPFAFDPGDHHRVAPAEGMAADVLFVGGGDADRIPLAERLVAAGFNLALYGGYWDRHTTTAQAYRGFGDVATIRSATGSAAVCLILVRRANRDGHVMRSFEAAACGGCLLVEDTAEHREIFADSVTYFRTPDEMVNQARSLLADPDRRRASAQASYRRIVTDGRNTYADRLRTILETTGTP
jgi:spore maturation protein CgeB